MVVDGSSSTSHGRLGTGGGKGRSRGRAGRAPALAPAPALAFAVYCFLLLRIVHIVLGMPLALLAYYIAHNRY